MKTWHWYSIITILQFVPAVIYFMEGSILLAVIWGIVTSIWLFTTILAYGNRHYE